MAPRKVLFVCVRNSARSQIAEALFNSMAGKEFFAQSAGLEPGKLNPLAIEVMREINMDISSNETKSVFDFYKNNEIFEFVITVCDAAHSQRCPIFPGITKRLHWSFEDPESFTGTYEEKIQKTRVVRDKIKKAVENLLNEIKTKE